MGEENREKLFFSQDPKILKIINEDLLTVICVGQYVQDILDGDPVPDEMLSVEDVSLLWAYLPEGRRAELTPHVRKFLGSIKDPPSDFGGWQKLHHTARFNTFEDRLSILMMASHAVSFREWLLVFNAAEENQIILKRIASEMMRQHANGGSEGGVAERKYKEVYR
ncbi:MAG: hypothetical protein NTW66_00540 [Candidatus Magasanikbacteria bacterium]|nr:hypothetical protein [Candidatus Magasanikbacteria bacterium]